MSFKMAKDEINVPIALSAFRDKYIPFKFKMQVHAYLLYLVVALYLRVCGGGGWSGQFSPLIIMWYIQLFGLVYIIHTDRQQRKEKTNGNVTTKDKM